MHENFTSSSDVSFSLEWNCKKCIVENVHEDLQSVNSSADKENYNFLNFNSTTKFAHLHNITQKFCCVIFSYLLELTFHRTLPELLIFVCPSNMQCVATQRNATHESFVKFHSQLNSHTQSQMNKYCNCTALIISTLHSFMIAWWLKSVFVKS